MKYTDEEAANIVALAKRYCAGEKEVISELAEAFNIDAIAQSFVKSYRYSAKAKDLDFNSCKTEALAGLYRVLENKRLSFEFNDHQVAQYLASSIFNELKGLVRTSKKHEASHIDVIDPKHMSSPTGNTNHIDLKELMDDVRAVVSPLQARIIYLHLGQKHSVVEIARSEGLSNVK